MEFTYNLASTNQALRGYTKILEATFQYAKYALQYELLVENELIKHLESYRSSLYALKAKNDVGKRVNKKYAVKSAANVLKYTVELNKQFVQENEQFIAICKQATSQLGAVLCVCANIAGLRESIDRSYAECTASVFNGGKCNLAVVSRAQHVCDELSRILRPADDASRCCLKQVRVSLCRAHKDSKKLEYYNSYFLVVNKTEQGRSDLLRLIRQKFDNEIAVSLPCCRGVHQTQKSFVAVFPQTLCIRIDVNANVKSAINNLVEVPEEMDLTEFYYHHDPNAHACVYKLGGYIYKAGTSFYIAALQKAGKVYLSSNGEVTTKKSFELRYLGIYVCFYYLK